MGSKPYYSLGIYQNLKAVAAMQRLFYVCLNIVDAQLACVLGAAQKVFNCCWCLAC